MNIWFKKVNSIKWNQLEKKTDKVGTHQRDRERGKFAERRRH